MNTDIRSMMNHLSLKMVLALAFNMTKFTSTKEFDKTYVVPNCRLLNSGE